jgi:PAS domain S-box-containing protein
VVEPVPPTLQTVVGMGVARIETERVPFADAAAYCAAPTGHGEVVVCAFSTVSCLGERFRQHVNEIASLAGAALFRAEQSRDTPETRAASGDTSKTSAPSGDTSEASAPSSEQTEREAVLDALDRSFPDYAFLHDRDGRYRDVLLGERNIGENTREEIVGSTVHEVLGRDAADRVSAAIRDALDEWETVSVEYPLETGGTEQYYEARVSPVQFRGRETAVLVARDVTELRRQREQLRQRNERLEAFTSIVSHDLKNPLNTAQGYLDLLERKLTRDAESSSATGDSSDQPPDDAESGDSVPSELRTVERALDRMAEISEGVLTIAHHEEATLQLERLSIRAVTADCWEMATTAEATLTVVDEFSFRADESSVRHVFENLFTNAVTHGGSEVTVRVGRTDDGLYVADDGPGIPEARRDAVFETGTSFGGGSGIGLVVVETVAEAHDWSVTVTDSWAGGARFELSGVDVVDCDGRAAE